MFEFLTTTFLGIEVDIWTLIFIPIAIFIFEFLKFVYHIVKRELIEKEYIIFETDVPYEKQSTSEKVKEENKVLNRTLESYLKKIRKKLDADRVVIGKFHNKRVDSHIYKGGNLWQSFSIVSEVLNYGISSEKKFFTNIPVAFYKSVLKPLSEQGYLIINDINELKGSELKVSLSLQGVKSFGAVPIITNNNEFIGVLMVQYVSRPKEITSDDIMYLKDNAHYFVDYIIKYYIKKEEDKND